MMGKVEGGNEINGIGRNASKGGEEKRSKN